MDIEGLNRALARVPRYMAEAVRGYVFEGIPPAGFLRAVLENDLYRACLLADENNRVALFGWGCVLSALPMDTWGNHKTVDKYLAHRHHVGALARGAGERKPK